MLVDGIREIKLLKKGNIKINEIYYCEDFLRDRDLLESLSCKNTFRVNSTVFSKIAFGDRKEGIVVVAEQPKKNLEDLEFNEQSVFVVVEAIEKPGNLGAIIRTCEAAGVAGLIVTEGKTDIYNPNVIRASLGTCFSLPLVEATREETLSWLKSGRIRIISSVPDSKISYWQVNFKLPCAIVFGSEDKGVSAAFLSLSESKITIPMQGDVDSLNVSTSVAIVVYELLRQRNISKIR